MIDEKTLNKVKEILFRYVDKNDYSLFIFGSRVSGQKRHYSDIEIGVEGKKPLTMRTRSRLQDAFDESDIPYTVDIVDFTTVSEKFKTNAKEHLFMLN